MDCSLPGSSVHGIPQARILEWVAISSSRRSSWPRDGTCVSCIGRWILYHCDTWEAILYYIWLYCSVCVCVLRWAFQNHQIQPACSGRLKLLPLPRTIYAQGSSSSPSTLLTHKRCLVNIQQMGMDEGTRIWVMGVGRECWFHFTDKETEDEGVI